MQRQDLVEIYYVPTLACAPGSSSEQDAVPGSWKLRSRKGADQGRVGMESWGAGQGWRGNLTQSG